MNIIKKQIIEYYQELINKIDLQSEKCLNKQGDNNTEEVEDDESNNINSIRNTFISKIKELELANLNCLSNESKVPFENGFCFLIENYTMTTSRREDTRNRGFGPAYRFHFENKIGKLVIVKEFINDKILFELNEIINQKRINFRKDEQNLSSFEEVVKLTVILDVIEKKFEDRLPIIDLKFSESIEMEKLFISSERMSNLKHNDFDCLKDFIKPESIKELRLTSPLWDSVPKKIFQNFTNLFELDLNCEKLDIIYNQNFACLENLATLSIINCSLALIEKDAFEGLKNLKCLVLTMNYLTDVNSSIFKGLENLEHLNLSQNTIEEIEENTFIDLKNLSSLTLTDNRIKILRNNALNGLVNLKFLELNFSNNELVIEPNAFESCIQLEVLDLGNNQIKNIDPQTFSNCKNLKFLNLRNNWLENLNFLKNFESLEFLDLSRVKNALYFVKNYQNLQTLKYLALTSNFIPKLSANLENLQGFEVDGVSIIDENAFENLKNLDYLKICIENDRTIENFTKIQFNGLRNMKYLAIETESIGPRAIEKFRDKEDIFLDLFNSDNEIDHRVFYLNFNDSNLLVAEIKDVISERFYFEKNLNVCVEAKNMILGSFYSDYDFCSNRLRNQNFMNF
ncbi:unnamed protein product [Brachionus calyciflorus]|uniref:Uncharacterized protein n=1 Tax=Brachionus calyciflorus TaxID=104777 RepID=A0A813VLQ9_9BILA|nr:unnamed protein product [Brachionus calyciflorus]